MRAFFFFTPKPVPVKSRDLPESASFDRPLDYRLGF